VAAGEVRIPVGVLKVFTGKAVAVATPGRGVSVMRGVCVGLAVELASGVSVMAGVAVKNSPVWVCAASTVCHIWVYASDESVVGEALPQADRLRQTDIIKSQINFVKRDMFSSGK
jgi:hypothetical protein